MAKVKKPKYIVTWDINKQFAKDISIPSLNLGYSIKGKQEFSNRKYAEEWFRRKQRSSVAGNVKLRRMK
tara:strand:- start:36 stop:242 length:207 start_codon:yes stop_codon:yes gene_type:complete